MTFKDWLINAVTSWPGFRDGPKYIDNDDYRFGQHLFNQLWENRKDIVQKLKNEDYTFDNGIDPFYLDENIGNFLAFVHQNWSK